MIKLSVPYVGCAQPTMNNDRSATQSLEPLATEIGRDLDRRGESRDEAGVCPAEWYSWVPDVGNALGRYRRLAGLIA